MVIRGDQGAPRTRGPAWQGSMPQTTRQLAISFHQGHSEAIRGHHRQSEVIIGNQRSS